LFKNNGVWLEVFVFEAVQDPMEKMLVHEFLVTEWNFTDDFLQELFHWILILVDVTLHENLIARNIITEVNISLPIDTSHDVIISSNDCRRSFAAIDACNSSEMIT
jgi:hypothetical protein